MKNTMKRMLSLLMCLALVVSYLPRGILTLVGGAAENAPVMMDTVRVTDPATLDQWKQYFGTQTNHPQGVQLSTEFAGGVWTDKSVFKPDSIPSQLTDAKYNQKGFTLNDAGNNFLVALSALASNKQIKGYSTIPTDTVLILDLSSSMRTINNNSSAVDELVEATNKAITELMALNENNRVSVVVYAGTDNASWSARNGKTRVILPLDNYTTNTAGTYLESVRDSQNRADYALQVRNGVKNSAGQAAHADTKFETSTGTFAQDGLYMGMQQLLNANPVVEEGFQAGVSRIPIMVLMTDGEPTLGHENYYGTYTTDGSGKKTFTDLGNSNLYSYSGSTADRNGTSHRDTIAFVSSLTASFAKKQITAHYGEEGLLYTLAYGNTVGTRSEAMSFLNPVNSSAIQNNLWNDFLAGEDVTVYRYTTGSGRNQQTHYLTTKNASDPDLKLTASDRYYVDEFFSATNDEAMRNAFDAIVDEIELQSRYYPTYVENDHNHDGYLTFVDKIGSYMEVPDILGIVIGDRLFSGEAMASAMTTNSMGTVTLPSGLGDKFVESVRERLGIENTTTAQTLINNAYQHGQLAYDNATGEFSHYIGWFSDENGKFVDFWHADLAKEDFPAEATHVMRSFGFLGDTTVIPGVPNTDMMFMTVRVATEIATGDSIVTWKIPASLVPTVTYEVEVELDSDGDLTGLTSLELASDSATHPIRLLYEVKLRRDITEWNIQEKTNGTTTFYSNKYDAADPFATALNTYSHFEPSEENERYYYTSDHLIYSDANGTVYTGAKPTGGNYYHRFLVYEKTAAGLRIHHHYEPITAISLALAESAGNNQWAIPKGTILRYQDDVTSLKTDNATGTMAYSDHPEIIAEGGHYYTYSTQGNNGKLTVTPATGIKLTKSLTETVDGASNSFTFTIPVNNSGVKVIRLDAEGNEASRTDLPANGQVTLTAGETVYVIGLAPGSYTVTENAHDDYTVTAVTVDAVAQTGKTAQVTLAAQQIADVVFTNSPKGYGSLIVSKDVVYPEGFTPTAEHNNKEFTISVTFNGDVSDIVAPATAQKNGNTYTLRLKDSQPCIFTNIPDGTTYTVEESNLPAGHSLTQIRYTDDTKTVSTDDADQAHVINTYAPAPVSANIKVQGTKTVTGGWPAGAAFTLRLWQIFGTELIQTNRIDTVVQGDASYSIDISNVAFDKVGTYYIRVAEDVPADADRIPDMAYDRTVGIFSVTVTDEDADGQLEIKEGAVVGYQGTPVTGNLQDGYIVEKNFNNVVTKDLVYIDVQKQIDGYTGSNPPVKDIAFGLFTSMNETDPAFNILTDDAGKATLMVPVTADGLGTTGVTYYLREIAPPVADRVVGLNYNESWLYAIRITWDSVNHVAVTEYAPIENGVVGTYLPYDRQTVSFTHINTYTPGVESTPAIELSGTKTISGDTTDLGNRRFSFSIYETDASFLPADGAAALQTVQNNGSSITFEGITFDTAGLKYLVIKENATTLGGVTVDSTEYHMTVLIEKYNANGTTKLRVADGYPMIVKYGNGTVAQNAVNFDNRYHITGETQLTVTGTKRMTGRPLLLGGFRFRLTEVTDASGNTVLTGGTALTAENGHADSNNTAPFHFPAITYTKEGTHYYLIDEVNTGATGVTYTDARYVIRVDVTDNGEGGLTAKQTIVSGGNSIVFHNSYKPQPVTTSLRSVKELRGMVLTAGQFSFTITQTGSDFATPVAGGLKATVTNGADGLIQFPDITFTGNDTRYYVIEEVNGGQTIDGITYDDAKYMVTVTATDNLLGSLVLVTDIKVLNVEEIDGQPTEVISSASSIAFVNEYAVKGDASLILTGGKTLNGKTLSDGMFTFQLLDEGGAVVASGTNAGSAYSIRLDYTAENDLGKTYIYTLREENSGQTIAGTTYDSAQYQITVKVNDDGKGGIVLDVTTTGQQSSVNKVTTVTGLDFVNTYTATETTVTLEGTKELTGIRPLRANDFTFRLYKTAADFAVTGDPVDTAKNKGNGDFLFDAQTLTTAGDHYFVVRESSDNPISGVTYDPAQYRVTVRVIDNGAGALSVESVTYVKVTAAATETASKIAFTNAYTTENAQVSVSGKKTLTGRTLKNGEFTFLLQQTDAQFAPLAGAPAAEKANSQNGTFTFEQLTFTQPGTYYYTVTEQKGAANVGITYDDRVYRITVVVTDNEAGKLIPAVTVDQTGVTVAVNGTQANVSDVQFANTYEAASVMIPQIEGSKTVNGQWTMKPGDFTFQIYCADAQFAIQGAAIGTATNDAAGKFTFDPIPVATDGTHRFVVKESSENPINGMTYDTTTYHLTVIAEDNGMGQLVIADTQWQKATAEGVTPATQVEFLNSYDAQDVTLSLSGKKVLQGKELTAGEFTFQLQAADDQFAPLAGTQPSQTVNAADGSFTFDAITYDAAGTYYYTVTEVNTGNERTTFDETVYRVTVTVTDENGVLKAVAAYATENASAEQITFTNIYTPKPADLPLTVTVQKTVKNVGTESIGPEGFTFVLEETEDVKIEATTGADGKVVFDLMVTEGMIGDTFNLKLYEKNGGKEHVTYSTAVHQIKIAVRLGADNKLVADLTVDGTAVEQVNVAFENVYDYTPPVTPETGDNMHLVLWFSLLGLSAMGLASILVFRKKIVR